MKDFAVLLGRVGLALVFLWSGWGKLQGYDATAAYMASAGIPGALLPLVIFVEIGGGLAVLTGALTFWAGAGLALFSLASAFLFHRAAPGMDAMAAMNQQIHFMKNIAMAGGLLVLAAHDPGGHSIDAWLKNRRK